MDVVSDEGVDEEEEEDVVSLLGSPLICRSTAAILLNRLSPSGLM